jgi:hypothetical protein
MRCEGAVLLPLWLQRPNPSPPYQAIQGIAEIDMQYLSVRCNGIATIDTSGMRKSTWLVPLE